MVAMKLHVILGPPGAGKAGRALSTLRDAAMAGVDAFLCVPGTVDRSRYLRELAGSAGGVVVGVEVGTFDQLVDRVAGSPPVRRTDRAMERIVVRDALRDVPALARAARWSGFVDTAREQVDRLRRARVWGGPELARVEQELPGEDVEHWHALEARYGELLDERRLRDDAWFERRAAVALRAGRVGVDSVVVHGFDVFAPSRIELLERLARVVPVTVTLPWRPGRRVHERAADLRDRWRARGAFIEEVDPQPSAEPVLDWLASELFEESSAPPPAGDPAPDAPAPVAFVDCCGPLQEAEEVVREVALLAARGCAWDDVVVASADAAVDGDLLLAAFQRAGIPARLQARRRAVDVPAGRSLHALLDSIISGDALALVAALRGSIFDVADPALDRAELRLRARRHHHSDAAGLRILRPLLAKPIAELLDLAVDRGAVDVVRAVIASLQPADEGELDLLRGVAALLEGLVTAAADEEHVTLADVRDAIAAFPLSTPDRSDAGAVVIASLDDLRSVAFDALVLRGMHLGGFRARVDDEADGPAAARDLLHLAVTRTRRTLRVVRQSAGSDGGHLAASLAWQELRRLLPHAPLRSRRLGEVLVPPDQVRLRAEVEASVALAMAQGIDVTSRSPDVDAAIMSLRPRRRRPRLDGPALDRVRARATVAATAVERYATCSAMWFIDRHLRLEDPDADRSRIIDGNLAHALLQRLVPAARATQSPDEIRVRAAMLADEIAHDIDDAAILDPARIERVTEHVLSVIEAERDWVAPDVIEVERNVGSDAHDPIAPGLRIDDVEVVGRVDRIDRYGSTVVLHDYKYGSTDRSAAKLLEERNLQLLVYWLALEQPGSTLRPAGALYRAVTRAGATSGVLSEELRELGMVAKGRRAGVLDEEEQRELLDETRALVTDVVGRMRRGEVVPLEQPSSCPAHCQLQTICRVGEVPA